MRLFEAESATFLQLLGGGIPPRLGGFCVIYEVRFTTNLQLFVNTGFRPATWDFSFLPLADRPQGTKLPKLEKREGRFEPVKAKKRSKASFGLPDDRS
jgi:hypothetical protein